MCFHCGSALNPNLGPGGSAASLAAATFALLLLLWLAAPSPRYVMIILIVQLSLEDVSEACRLRKPQN